MTYALVAATLGLAAGSAHAQEKPVLLWMSGNVETPPPPNAPYGRPSYFHGDREVSIPEFVRIAGHDELADRLERRTRNRRLVMLGGLAVAIAGGVIGFTAPKCNTNPVEPQCADDRERQQLVGLGVFVAGAGIVGGAKLFLPNLRPPYHVLRKMERDHNKRVQVTPVVSANSAGVQAQLRF